MFSSNQKLLISGTLDVSEIKNALLFAITKASRSNSYCYQISPDKKKFCIGVNYDDTPPEGWHDFSFDFDVDIVARIIKQHLEKQDVEYGSCDGAYTNGFLMKVINDECNHNINNNGIKNSYYGIVSFEPYTNFYAK